MRYYFFLHKYSVNIGLSLIDQASPQTVKSHEKINRGPARTQQHDNAIAGYLSQSQIDRKTFQKPGTAKETPKGNILLEIYAAQGLAQFLTEVARYHQTTVSVLCSRVP